MALTPTHDGRQIQGFTHPTNMHHTRERQLTGRTNDSSARAASVRSSARFEAPTNVATSARAASARAREARQQQYGQGSARMSARSQQGGASASARRRQAADMQVVDSQYEHLRHRDEDTDTGGRPPLDSTRTISMREANRRAMQRSHLFRSAQSGLLAMKGGVGVAIANRDVPEELAQLKRARGVDPATEVSELTSCARPRASTLMPLKSMLLDKRVNTLVPSRTQSQLRAAMKKMDLPHASYDIDGDGYVSQEDLFLAKRFDVDGNGVLDEDEMLLGKSIMAEEFFRAHEHDIDAYGAGWGNRTQKENVDQLSRSKTFSKTLRQLKNLERAFITSGSDQMAASLVMADQRPCMTNYYTNKMDATAWNDFGAQPREANYAKVGHRGSRHKLENQRHIQERLYGQARLDAHEATKPKFSLARTNEITADAFLT